MEYDTSALEYLICEYAPKLMKTGGGGVAREAPERIRGDRHCVSNEEKQRMAALIEDGHSIREIMNFTGRAYNTVVCNTREVRQRLKIPRAKTVKRAA